MNHKLFVDTSAWIAYSVEAESYNKEVAKIFKDCIKNNVALFTSNDVINETVTRLIYQAGLHKTGLFYALYEGYLRNRIVVEFWVDEHTRYEAWRFLNKYKDHKLSMTDATSVILMQRFGIKTILSLDSDFKKIGINSLP